MKLCKDCRNLSNGGIRNVCFSPNNGLSKVHGHPKPASPELSRENELWCGPDAKWFVEKPEQKSLWQRIFG